MMYHSCVRLQRRRRPSATARLRFGGRSSGKHRSNPRRVGGSFGVRYSRWISVRDMDTRFYFVECFKQPGDSRADR